jgi:hypothetical protein
VNKPSKERFSHFPKEEAFMLLLNLFRQQQAVGDIPKSGPMVENRTRTCSSLDLNLRPLLLASPTKGKDIVFRFIIEYIVAQGILAPTR